MHLLSPTNEPSQINTFEENTRSLDSLANKLTSKFDSFLLPHVFNQHNPEQAIEKYVGDTYTQHNPHVGDGKDAFIDYFIRVAKDYPEKKVEFKRAMQKVIM